MAHLPSPPFTVGFALETQDLKLNAEKKLKDKKLDMIIANSLSENTGFDVDTNAVTILYKDGECEEWGLMKKTTLAQELIKRIAQQHSTRHSFRHDILQLA